MDDVTGLQIRLETALDEIRHLNESHAKDRAELAQWRGGVRRIVYRVCWPSTFGKSTTEFAYVHDAWEYAHARSSKVLKVTIAPKPKGATK